MKLIASACLLAVLCPCASATPPSGIERAFFSVQTNWITNVFPVAQINPSNNVVTNSFLTTNIEVRYKLEPKPAVTETISTVSSVATTSGVGWAGLAGTFVISLLYGWAELRNRQKAKVNGVLTNNVAVGHATILATAGAAVAEQFLESIKSTQVKADVKEDIAAVVDSQVDGKEAHLEAASVVSLAKANPVTQ